MSEIWWGLGLLFVIGLVALTLVGELVVVDHVDITIDDKDIKAHSEGSKYLVFTDGEVFENTDSWLNGKFDSSDVYNNLDVGKTYHCKVVGWRIQIMSWYRNIITYEEVGL